MSTSPYIYSSISLTYVALLAYHIYIELKIYLNIVLLNKVAFTNIYI